MVRHGMEAVELVPVAVQSLAVIDNRLFGVGSGGVVAFGPESS
jgi:hypothetical protein